MPVDPLVLRRRLRALERYLRVLRALRERGREAFVHDEAVQDRVERNVELLAQTCTDICLHIVSASGTAAPETYSDAVRAAAPIIALPADLTDRLAAAVRLRNMLAHMYLDIDHGRLFDELGWIEDTETFAAAVERWLAAEIAQS
ncbi:MAG TPA: HepT-like ribonuclease domain-containing protein [Gammaproteobacteria bacterium]|nr:HepT-like ribonuclease domain-containing protein [Gammaproteobacteria bacterium]